ncbi:MAG: hypothetical protein OXG25_06575 [Gammaproteobacteria bacterium]|nr:hypothetical protein [Gammaproteobacteria bacterium]
MWWHRFLAETRQVTPLGGVVKIDETFLPKAPEGGRHLRECRPPRKHSGLMLGDIETGSDVSATACGRAEVCHSHGVSI